MSIVGFEISPGRVYELLTIAKKTQFESKDDQKFIDIANDISNGNLDFAKLKYKKINGRTIAFYDDPLKPTIFSAENVVLLHLKNEVEKRYAITFSNRNRVIEELFDALQVARNLHDFTIIKFDFKKFFYTISTQYVYDHFIDNGSLSRQDKELIREYTDKVPYCVAGLPINNYLVEIISKQFDKEIRMRFAEYGLVFYERYVDDGILLLNTFIPADKAEMLLKEIIKVVFSADGNNTSVRIGKRKFQVINRRALIAGSGFDFLGYDFHFGQDFSSLEVGVTQAKIDKYQKKINGLVKKHYKPRDKQSRELIRQIIKINSSRVVYYSGKRQKDAWISKGFIANYNMLKGYSANLDQKTEKFLRNVYHDAFSLQGHSSPSFLNSPRYSLYENLKANRAMIFNERVGMSKEQLLKELKKIQPTVNKSADPYDKILRYYLIDGVRAGY